MPSATPKNKNNVAELIDEKPKTGGYKPVDGRRFFTNIRDLPLFTFLTIRAMDLEPTILIGEAARRAPMLGIEFAHKEGDKWISGIDADSPEIASFVLRQLKRIWLRGIEHMLTDQTWGWSGSEVMLQLTPQKTVEIDYLLPRAAGDIRALEREGELCGAQFQRIKGSVAGNVELEFPKCIFTPFFPEPGTHYGTSIRYGAYSPWADKWLNGGALDVRRLFMHKDAYGGADMAYPDGFTEITQGGQSISIPNRDIARQIVEQYQAGGVTTRPSDLDDKGNNRWQLTRATIPSNPSHIFQYPDDCDVEMLRGMLVPDGVLIEGETGAWKGRAIPLSVFFSVLDLWASGHYQSADKCCISHLVEMTFGPGKKYEIQHKPFAEQEAEKQSSLGQQNGPPQAQPQQKGVSSFGGFGRDADGDGEFNEGKRMGLDPVEAVGRGVLDAAELVKAARKAMRSRIKRLGDFKESEHPRDEDGKFGEKGHSGVRASHKKSFEPTSYEDPQNITPVNEVRNRRFLKALTGDMEENGWTGRPVITYKHEGETRAVTGSHRIFAAIASRTEVPVLEVPESSLDGEVDKSGRTLRDHLVERAWEDGDLHGLFNKFGLPDHADLADIEANPSEFTADKFKGSDAK